MITIAGALTAESFSNPLLPVGEFSEVTVTGSQVYNLVSSAVSEYTVQPGDNIFTVSRRMNVSFTELAAANDLSSPRDVRVGKALVSPSAQRDAM